MDSRRLNYQIHNSSVTDRKTLNLVGKDGPTSFPGSLILPRPGAHDFPRVLQGGGKMRDPGNEVEDWLEHAQEACICKQLQFVDSIVTQSTSNS